MDPKLVLNTVFLKKYLRERSWTLVELSERMGLSYDMVHKVLRGNRNPGGRFVAGLLIACEGRTFDQFFVVCSDD